jgi:acyl-coenzyme A thioesterase 13
MTWRFPIQREYLNVNQQYAGGAQAAVHDTCTGWALLTVAKPGFWASLGSTRALNLSFLNAPSVGDTVRLECKVRTVWVFARCDLG